MNEEFKETAIVQLFPGKGGWHYVRLPSIYKEMSMGFANRGIVPIVATIGNTTWKTSLLPFKSGEMMLAIKLSVRKAENINLRDKITIKFRFA